MLNIDVNCATLQVGSQRLSTGQYIGQPLTAEKLEPSTRSGTGRPMSSDFDDFSVKNPPRKLEMSSPSRSGFQYGHRRMGARQKYYSEDARNRLETSTASNLINEREHENLRALIDAYGNDDRDASSKSKPLAVGLVGNSKVATISWQDTEEQEFDWEDMSPTLADEGRRNKAMPFGQHRVPATTSLDVC